MPQQRTRVSCSRSKSDDRTKGCFCMSTVQSCSAVLFQPRASCDSNNRVSYHLENNHGRGGSSLDCSFCTYVRFRNELGTSFPYSVPASSLHRCNTFILEVHNHCRFMFRCRVCRTDSKIDQSFGETHVLSHLRIRKDLKGH